MQYKIQAYQENPHKPLTTLPIDSDQKIDLVLTIENVSLEPLFLKDLEIKIVDDPQDQRYLGLTKNLKTDFSYKIKNKNPYTIFRFKCRKIFQPLSLSLSDPNNNQMISHNVITFLNINLAQLEGLAHIYLTEEIGEMSLLSSQTLKLIKIKPFRLIENFDKIFQTKANYQISLIKLDTRIFDLYLYSRNLHHKKLEELPFNLVSKIPSSPEIKTLIFPSKDTYFEDDREFIVLASIASEPLEKEISLTLAYSYNISFLLRVEVDIPASISSFEIIAGLDLQSGGLIVKWQTVSLFSRSLYCRKDSTLHLIKDNVPIESESYLIKLQNPNFDYLLLKAYDKKNQEYLIERPIKICIPHLEIIDTPFSVEIGDWIDIIWRALHIRDSELSLEIRDQTENLLKRVDKIPTVMTSYRQQIKWKNIKDLNIKLSAQTYFQGQIIIQHKVEVRSPSLEFIIEKKDKSSLKVGWQSQNVIFCQLVIKNRSFDTQISFDFLPPNMSSFNYNFDLFSEEIELIGYNRNLYTEKIFCDLKHSLEAEIIDIKADKDNYQIGDKIRFTFRVTRAKKYIIFFIHPSGVMIEIKSSSLSSKEETFFLQYNLLFPTNRFLLRLEGHEDLLNHEIEINCQYKICDKGLFNCNEEKLIKVLGLRTNIYHEYQVNNPGDLIVGLIFPKNIFKGLVSLITSKIEDLYDPNKRRIEKMANSFDTMPLVTLKAEIGYALAGLKVTSALIEPHVAIVSQIEAIWKAPFGAIHPEKKSLYNFGSYQESYTIETNYMSNDPTEKHFIYSIAYYPYGEEFSFLRKVRLLSLNFNDSE